MIEGGLKRCLSSLFSMCCLIGFRYSACYSDDVTGKPVCQKNHVYRIWRNNMFDTTVVAKEIKEVRMSRICKHYEDWSYME